MRQAAATLVGGVLVVLGIVLLPLPGPGLLVIFGGLTVLATQWDWADRLAGSIRHRVVPARRAERTPVDLPATGDVDSMDRAA